MKDFNDFLKVLQSEDVLNENKAILLDAIGTGEFTTKELVDNALIAAMQLSIANLRRYHEWLHG